jgi:hypothetical protein
MANLQAMLDAQRQTFSDLAVSDAEMADLREKMKEMEERLLRECESDDCETTEEEEETVANKQS